MLNEWINHKNPLIAGQVRAALEQSKGKAIATRVRAGRNKATWDSGLLLLALTGAGLPLPAPEYRFHATRRWRFDFAWIEERVALEIDGGTYQANSAHRSVKDSLKDMDKFNAATALGWRVIHARPEQVPGAAGVDLTGDWLDCLLTCFGL